ncbi:MAG TPA: STAS domain-containing protein [Isosphaeraceae bacterium]|jgi:stage II sporulation protein AA (anti-sigma F factor antagonist)|nr:STAS domain-containing protein [Isosphaeraceae bacterium]
MEVRLVAQAGPAQGQAVDVRAAKFFIGSHANCQLRPAIPGLAGLHTLIEQREGRVLVRDFGSGGGTMVNDQVLHSKEIDLSDGDVIKIGPLELKVQLAPRTSADPPALVQVPEGWPLTEPVLKPKADPAAGSWITAAPQLGDRPLETKSLSYKAVGNALVVTLLTPELTDERTIGRLRFELRALLDQPLPRRVVLDLSNVTFLSSSAVGVILAHNQGLSREGGALRVCNVHSRVLPVLEQMRMNMIIDIYKSLDEALADSWE